MIDYKNVFSVLAILIAIGAYVPYFKDIFAGKTKPHVFTWLIWGLINGIVFVGQLVDGGGAGAWPVGFTAIVTLSIFLIALKKGEKDIKTVDRFFLIASIAAIPLWYFSDGPLLSVILVTIIDLLGFVPTIRKSYNKPHEETLATYALGIIKYFFVIVALRNYSLVTMIFPVAMVAVHIAFVTLLTMRRKQLLNSET